MPALPLSFACAAYDRMVPLLTGEVKPAGIDLNFIPIASPRDIFDRMAGRLEFDCYEFSSSELISQVGAGASALTAIPVFPSPSTATGSSPRRTSKASASEFPSTR